MEVPERGVCVQWGPKALLPGQEEFTDEFIVGMLGAECAIQSFTRVDITTADVFAGWADMETPEDAERAAALMDGFEYDGRRFSVMVFPLYAIDTTVLGARHQNYHKFVVLNRVASCRIDIQKEKLLAEKEKRIQDIEAEFQVSTQDVTDPREIQRCREIRNRRLTDEAKRVTQYLHHISVARKNKTRFMRAALIDQIQKEKESQKIAAEIEAHRKGEEERVALRVKEYDLDFLTETVIALMKFVPFPREEEAQFREDCVESLVQRHQLDQSLPLPDEHQAQLNFERTMLSRYSTSNNLARHQRTIDNKRKRFLQSEKEGGGPDLPNFSDDLKLDHLDNYRRPYLECVEHNAPRILRELEELKQPQPTIESELREIREARHREIEKREHSKFEKDQQKERRRLEDQRQKEVERDLVLEKKRLKTLETIELAKQHQRRVQEAREKVQAINRSSFQPLVRQPPHFNNLEAFPPLVPQPQTQKPTPHPILNANAAPFIPPPQRPPPVLNLNAPAFNPSFASLSPPQTTEVPQSMNQPPLSSSQHPYWSRGFK